MTKDEILNRVRRLNVYRRGERRAPHKPLLLLLAIAEQQRGVRKLAYREVEDPLRKLLDSYAPPVQGRHDPSLPYWHLQSDGLWQVTDADTLPRTAGGFPRMDALQLTVGSLPQDFLGALDSDPTFPSQITGELLTRHFPVSLHDELAAKIGFTQSTVVAGHVVEYEVSRQRDPAFRTSVLQAYEQRCAVTGLWLALDGTIFGCEAAHIKWHAYNGPDKVANGLALSPTMHKLFDRGAWTLTDDNKVLVSRNLTGDDTSMQHLRSHHKKPIRPPLSEKDQPSPEFIKWHRDPGLGGVFKGQPLD